MSAEQELEWLQWHSDILQLCAEIREELVGFAEANSKANDLSKLFMDFFGNIKRLRKQDMANFVSIYKIFPEYSGDINSELRVSLYKNGDITIEASDHALKEIDTSYRDVLQKIKEFSDKLGYLIKERKDIYPDMYITLMLKNNELKSLDKKYLPNSLKSLPSLREFEDKSDTKIFRDLKDILSTRIIDLQDKFINLENPKKFTVYVKDYGKGEYKYKYGNMGEFKILTNGVYFYAVKDFKDAYNLAKIDSLVIIYLTEKTNLVDIDDLIKTLV